jgi:NAD(P)-dependent dehydrogenase (short-subunit alcohol dehydrogenase family)
LDAIGRLKSDTNVNIDLLVADLSSLEQVRSLASEIALRYSGIYTLINNAGLWVFNRQLTVDGFELTFAVNHLAPFLLTNLLLREKFAEGSIKRIINVSSALHKWGRIQFSNLMGELQFNGNRAYSQSKLANVMYTYELARRLKGQRTTVNALTPGMVNTGLVRHYTGHRRIMAAIGRLIMKTPQVGAQTSIYLASSADVEDVSGQYFEKCKAVKTSPGSYDRDVAARLWKVSAELTDLE